jgi:LmbE family N-acetylglucosaminyl deacetylase
MPADDAITRILVVTAHPDDVDFGVAGSVAHWTDAGIDVAYCIITNGEAGGFDDTIPRSTMAEIRQSEQRAAAKVVGVTDLTFLGYPDGRLMTTIELRRDISRVIRQVRPQRVVCQPPERNYVSVYASHPDHLAAGDAALAAVYPDARNPFAHPELAAEGYEAHAAREVWMMGAPSGGGQVVDITDQVERKIAALLCHGSQLPDPSRIEPLVRTWAAAIAAEGGLPEGRLAESFQVVETA